MTIIKLNNNAEQFAGAYVFLLHWTFIFEISEENRQLGISLEPFANTSIEEQLTKKDIPYFKLKPETVNIIDWTETERINDINIYIKLNDQLPAPGDISPEEVKKFRTWFAEYVLNSSTLDFSDDKSLTEYQKRIKAVLGYWSKNMNTDLIKELELFYNSSLITVKSTGVSCGCGDTTGTSMSTNMFQKGITCNPLDELYKLYIRNTESILSDVGGFWKPLFTSGMIEWTIKYLECILKYNLPLNFDSTYEGSQLSCSKLNRLNEINSESRQMMLDIIESLRLIMNCKENERFNFVNKAMTNFGKIYPYLYWD